MGLMENSALILLKLLWSALLVAQWERSWCVPCPLAPGRLWCRGHRAGRGREKERERVKEKVMGKGREKERAKEREALSQQVGSQEVGSQEVGSQGVGSQEVMNAPVLMIYLRI